MKLKETTLKLKFIVSVITKIKKQSSIDPMNEPWGTSLVKIKLLQFYNSECKVFQVKNSVISRQK